MSISPNTLEVLGMNSRGLILALEESFPPTNPNPEDTMEKIMFRSGQRSVVEWVINYMEARASRARVAMRRRARASTDVDG